MIFQANGSRGLSDMVPASSTVLMTGVQGEIGHFMKIYFHRAGYEVVDFESYEGVPQSYEKPTRLLHLAARADSQDINRLLDSNVNYLASVAQRAIGLGIDEIIFFSSATVYGNQDKDGVTEADCLVNPPLYGVSKLLGERLLESRPEIRSLCLRLPGVMEINRSTTFISRTYNALQAGKPVILHNAKRRFNHYLAIPVLAEFLMGVTMHTRHDVINLAPSIEMTLYQVVDHLRSCIGSSSEIRVSPECRPFFSLSTRKAETDYQFNKGNPREQIEQWVRMRPETELNAHV